MLSCSKTSYWIITFFIILLSGTLGILSSVPYPRIFIFLSLFILFMLLAFLSSQWANKQRQYFQANPDKAKEHEENKIIDDHPILFGIFGEIVFYIVIGIIIGIGAGILQYFNITF